MDSLWDLHHSFTRQQAHLLLASWQPAAWYLSSSLGVGAGKWSGKAGCHSLPNGPRMLGLFVVHENKWGLERVPFHRCSSISSLGGGHSELQLASSWQGSWLKVSSWHQCSLGSLEAKSWEARLQCLRFLEEMWPQQNRFLQASWCFAPIALKEAAWPCTY